MSYEQMKLFRKGLNALRMIEHGAMAYGKILDEVLETVRAQGLENEFWYYCAKH